MTKNAGARRMFTENFLTPRHIARLQGHHGSRHPAVTVRQHLGGFTQPFVPLRHGVLRNGRRRGGQLGSRRKFRQLHKGRQPGRQIRVIDHP